MANYDSIDLDWSWDGDYAVDQYGDIQDTSRDYLLSLANEVQTVMKSESSDWEKDITLGANLVDFVGEPNTRETGSSLEARVKAAIVNQGIIQGGDISVRIVPVHTT